MPPNQFNKKGYPLKTEADIQDTYSQIAKACSLEDEAKGVNSLIVLLNGTPSKEATQERREAEAKRFGLIKYIENNKSGKVCFKGVFDKGDLDKYGLPTFKYVPHCIL